MTDLRKVLGILQDARELVRANWGCCNMDIPMEAASGSICASVGIATACGADRDAKRAAHAAFLRGAGLPVPALYSEILSAVYAFNDAQTSVAPVLAAFDRAIATVEAELSPEPTPNADAALEVMAACESAGAVVARHIVSRCPQTDLGEITTLVSAELFYAAQDTAQACSLGVVVER